MERNWKQKIKIIYYIDYNLPNRQDGMDIFGECEFSKCIITGNENFIETKHGQGIKKFDAVAINIENYKEDQVYMFFQLQCSFFFKFLITFHLSQVYIDSQWI